MIQMTLESGVLIVIIQKKYNERNKMKNYKYMNKKCKLNKDDENYFYWGKINVMGLTHKCKVFPNLNKDLHIKVLKGFKKVLTNQKRAINQ